MPYKPTGRRVGRPEKEDAYKPVSVKLPPDLLERVRQYALIHQQSLSELIRDGLEWRISEGDVGYFRNTENQSITQADTGNTVILREVKRLVERLAGIVGASEVRAAQELREELDYGNTVLQEIARSRSLGRPSIMREPIIALLRSHPEGLSVEQIRGLLSPEKPLGDTLQGMRRSHAVRTEGNG